MKVCVHDAVEVLWRDSVLLRGWRSGSDVRPSRIRSVGVLVRRRRRSITLAVAMSPNGWAGAIVIPTSAIRRIRRLR